MSDNTGRRRNVPSDPTAERTSDPLPTGEDVIVRRQPGDASPRPSEAEVAPRRYEQPVEEDPVFPSNDTTRNTQI
jgi:hypothetical protein